MSGDELALLRTIIKEPECDTARLVYADWLEEDEQTQRAEFIRRQIGGHLAHDLFDTEWLPDCGGYLREWYFHSYPPDHIQDRPFSFLINRGFIQELRCTLAEFMGGRCHVCATRVIDGYACWRCNGTGTTPGLAHTLFGTHPITRVMLTDKKPFAHPVPAGGSRLPPYRWFRRSGPETSSIASDAIFELIDDSNEDHLYRHYWKKYFLTEKSALDALSLACVNWARSLHKFDPLKLA